MAIWTKNKTRALRNGIAAIGIATFGVIACGEEDPSAVVAPEGAFKFTITEDDLVIGDRDAPITIVEYSSMTCPHCAHFHEAIYPQLKTKYFDTGKAKLVMRPFFWDGPAANAALLANCAPERIKLPLIEAIFASQQVWLLDPGGPNEGLVKIAKQAMISREAFGACLADPENQAWAKRHLDEAANIYQVNSTPTFFINGEKATGIQDFAQFDRIMAKFTGEVVSDSKTGTD